MIRSFSLTVLLASSPAWTAVVGVSTGDGSNGNNSWNENSKSPYSFGVLDEDADGKLTNGEMVKARQQFALALKATKAELVGAIDSDNSGKLSRYESAEAAPRWNSLRERARDLAVATNDINGDGAVTVDEARGLENRIGLVFQKYGAKAVDTNNDKNLSRKEVDAAIESIKMGKGSMFKLCDLNNDGQLSVRETNMAFDLLAAAAGS